MFFLSTLTSNHSTPKLTQWIIVNIQISSRCAVGEINLLKIGNS